MSKNHRFKILIYIISGLIGIILVRQLIAWWRGPRVSLDGEFLTSETVDQSAAFITPHFSGKIPDNWPDQMPILTLTYQSDTQLLGWLDDYCQISEVVGESHYGQICGYFTYTPETIFLLMNDQDAPAQIIDLDLAKQSAVSFLNQFYASRGWSFADYGYQIENAELNALIEVDPDEDGEELPDTSPFFESEDPDPNAATSVIFYFVADYANWPLAQHFQNENNWSVNVDSNYQLISAQLPSQLQTITPSRDYQLISLNEALTNIGHGQAYTDYLTDDFDITHWQKITLSSVFLEYRLTADQSQAIPCYNFFGTGLNQDGQSVELSIVTPAIPFRLTL